MPRRPPIRLAALVALVACLVACGNPARREATSLTEAVDRYRQATDGPSRQVQSEAVAAVACTDVRVCDAKQACVAAIEPTVRSLALKDEVIRRLDDLEHKRLDPASPEAQALPGKLDEAEQLLKDGRTRMTVCDARLRDLRVSLGV
jgi:hypothetical protein